MDKVIITDIMLKRLLKHLTVGLFKLKCIYKMKIIVSFDVFIPFPILRIRGKGNSVIIREGASIKYCRFFIHGNNNKIIIHRNCNLKNVTFWMEGNNNLIEVGENTTTERNVEFAACENTSIRIGSDCMFSHDIYCRTTDSHCIKDKETGERINHAKSINIGNHVWVGMQCLILKGSSIGNNSILAARCMTTKYSDCENNIILAGSPARKIKANILWNRKL